MGDVSAHTRKAKHNEAFLMLVQKFDSLQKPSFPDWLVTVAFYIAVQYVDAKLAQEGKHPGNHPERNHFVATLLRHLGKDYFFLKNKSERARYIPDSEKYISSSTVKYCIDLAISRFL